MKEVMEVLQNNGFTEKHFYVPFSNWDYPKFEQKAWKIFGAKQKKHGAMPL